MEMSSVSSTRRRNIFAFHRDGTLPDDVSSVFVFGSNERGIHGAGAAQVAAQRYGAPRGPAGARGPLGPGVRCYAIATKDATIRRALPLSEIEAQVLTFLRFASRYPERQMWVTRIGCGLAGYADSDIAPMFRSAPANCSFALQWRGFLEAS